MTDARANRIRNIAEACHGSVLDIGDETAWCEIPQTMIEPWVTLLGKGGFCALLKGQTTRPDRGMETAFYRYHVSLDGHGGPIVSGDPHAIMKQVNP